MDLADDPDELPLAHLRTLSGETEEERRQRHLRLLERFAPPADRARLRRLVRGDFDA